MTDADRCVAALPEHQRLLWARCVHPAGTFAAFPRADVGGTVAGRFERQVRLHADRLAIKVADERWSYGTLNTLANRLAWAILGARPAHATPVALLFEQGPQAIAGMLGALKAGHPYVPLDPAHPPARLAHIAADCGPALLLTDAQHAPLARTLLPPAGRIAVVDELPASLPTENPERETASDALACLIYTSGSTGQPKGVMHTQRTVLHMIMNLTNVLHFCRDDRITLLYSPAVVGALRSILMALLNGGALFPRALTETGTADLAAWLREEGITFLRSVPLVFRQAMGALTPGDTFPALRLVWVGGDVVDLQDVNLYKRSLPDHCMFVHGWGATETGLPLVHFIDKATSIDGGRVPLGYPVDGTRIAVLDDDGTEVPDGEVGELAIGDHHLALGYWGQPGLTEAAFRTSPDGTRMYCTGDIGRRLPDGCVEHRGRKEWSVKVRGFRVALGEVERALREVPGIADAAVVPWGEVSGETRLAAYVVATPPAPAPGDIRRFLHARLPAFMVPATVIALDDFPRTPNGKVDRRRLPSPATSRPALATPFANPRTPVEQGLASLWSTVLGLDQVGIHDAFLDLGGDSLSAMRIVNRVREMWQVEIPPRLLFETSTVAEMALLVTQYMVARSEPGATATVLDDIDPGSSGRL